MKKIAWYTVFSLVVMLMVVAVFIYIAPHIGWHVSAVLSGSMEPALETGSLVVTRPVALEEIEVGDIITFNSGSPGERMITHRVIGIQKNSPISFRTQGDNCGMPDPFSVPAENLVGEICLHIPYGGNFTEFLKTPAGFISSVIVPGILIFVMYVISVWRAVIERKNRGVAEKAFGLEEELGRGQLALGGEQLGLSREQLEWMKDPKYWEYQKQLARAGQPPKESGISLGPISLKW